MTKNACPAAAPACPPTADPWRQYNERYLYTRSGCGVRGESADLEQVDEQS